MKLRNLVFISAMAATLSILTGCENTPRDGGGQPQPQQQAQPVTQPPQVELKVVEEPQVLEPLEKGLKLQIVSGDTAQDVAPSESKKWNTKRIDGQTKDFFEYEFANTVSIPDPAMLATETESQKFLVLSTSTELKRVTYTWDDGPSAGKRKKITQSEIDDFWYVSLTDLYSETLEQGVSEMGKISLTIEVESKDGRSTTITTKIDARPFLFDLPMNVVVGGEDFAGRFTSPLEYSQWRASPNNQNQGWKILTDSVSNPSSRSVWVSLVAMQSPGSEIYSEISNHFWTWPGGDPNSSPVETVTVSSARMSNLQIWAKLVRATGVTVKNDFVFKRVDGEEQGFLLTPGETVELQWIMKSAGTSCHLNTGGPVELKHPLFPIVPKIAYRNNGDALTGMRAQLNWKRSVMISELDFPVTSMSGWSKWSVDDYQTYAPFVRSKLLEEDKTYSVTVGAINGASIANSCQGVF